MFIGREKELKALQEVYDKKGFGMTILYGRRRIGKSTLITEFIKDKRAVFYTATKVGKGKNLELFCEQVITSLVPSITGAVFSSTEAVFDLITGRLSDEKLVLVIDELPYWAEEDEALLSVMQKYIDTKWADRELMIILCGSTLSFMEKKVLSEKSPLFGRRTSQIKLEPFDYKDAALFVPEYCAHDKAICYGITGGVAKYLSLINPKKSLDDNIKKLFFSIDGYLYDETRNLLCQEFTDITLINNILEQIASGENALNIISAKVHEKENTVLYSLDKLISVGLVERRKCITEEKNKKKTQYVLKDGMFRFWYRFVPKAHSIIELGEGGLYYEKLVKPRLHEFMGGIFEEMCRHYTLAAGIRGCFGNFITEAGTWWGTETVTDENGVKRNKPADIDVVALSQTDKTAVIGECKFRNEKTDKSVYDTLTRRASLISGKYTVTRYIFFSLGGYTTWFDEISDNNVILLSLEDLYA